MEMQFKQEFDGDLFPTDVEVKLEDGVDDESMRRKYEVRTEPTGCEEIDEQVEDDSTGAGSPEIADREFSLPIDRNQNICPVSDGQFREHESVRKHHHLTGTEKKSYECNSCDKMFSTSHKLKRHMLTHSGEKPHQCGDCDKKFARLDSLQGHQRTHTGDKPHQCTDCGRYFAWLTSLKQHKLTHTGETPYKCKECDKSFSHSANLKMHKVTHTGEKPYSCEDCDKSFTQLASLKRHKSIHTGGKLP